MTITIGIYIYDDVEVLDFTGPLEVFSTASRVNKRLHPDDPDRFRVILIAATQKPIIARAGLLVMPMETLETNPSLDVLILPGGVIDREIMRDETIKWILKVTSNVSLVASICTGAFLLAKAGLLDGRQCTTHWEDVGDLRKMFPMVSVLDNVRWVESGNIITSAGISAGIDMSLRIVEMLADTDLAIKTARQMEYVWRDIV